MEATLNHPCPAQVQYSLLDGTRLDDERRTSSELQRLVARINGAVPGAVEYVEMASSKLTLPVRLALWKRCDVLVGTCVGIKLFKIRSTSSNSNGYANETYPNFEISTRGEGSSKTQPNRLRFDRARDF